MNIILCGMMGAGKTTIGIELSKITKMRRVDTDEMVVEKYGKISDIFEKYGETYFRTLETEIVKKVSEQDGLIVSTGGGCMLKAENVEIFKKNGKIVFLRASGDTIYKRVGHTGNVRPLLKVDARGKIDELLRTRTPVYAACADYIIDTDELTIEEVAKKITERFNLV